MRAPARGFTLLEVVVAVAIFAIAMGLAYSGLDAAVRARGQLAESSERLARIELIFGMLERDVRSALQRTVRDESGEVQAALALGRGGFAVTRARGSQTLSRPGPDADRVHWTWSEDALIRLQRSELDPGPGRPRGQSVELAGCSLERLEALSTSGRWHEQWPPQGEPPEAWPRALRWRGRVEGLGVIERLIELPAEVTP